MSATVRYNGSQIATVSNETKILNTEGKWLTGDITITDNSQGGGYDVDSIADLSAPSGAMVLNGDKIGAYAFYGRTEITSLSGANVTSLGGYSFVGCSKLASISLPMVSGDSPANCFQNCKALTQIKPNDLYRLRTLGQALFNGCSNLQTIVMPTARAVAYQATQGCSALTAIDIGDKAITGGTGIATGAFGTASALNILILRRSQLIPLANVNAFANTPFKSGGTGGTIYVPNDLISSYKTATNWSTLYGYGTVTFLPIEGSQYENHYVDGTAIE